MCVVYKVDWGRKKLKLDCQSVIGQIEQERRAYMVGYQTGRIYKWDIDYIRDKKAFSCFEVHVFVIVIIQSILNK